MNTEQLIELLGGPSQVKADTGLSKGRISQWVAANKITRSWLEFYKLKRPDIKWDQYRPSDHCDDDSTPICHTPDTSIPGTPIDGAKVREAKNGTRKVPPNTKGVMS